MNKSIRNTIHLGVYDLGNLIIIYMVKNNYFSKIIKNNAAFIIFRGLLINKTKT
jgi:hypothetical protein